MVKRYILRSKTKSLYAVLNVNCMVIGPQTAKPYTTLVAHVLASIVPLTVTPTKVSSVCRATLTRMLVGTGTVPNLGREERKPTSGRRKTVCRTSPLANPGRRYTFPPPSNHPRPPPPPPPPNRQQANNRPQLKQTTLNFRPTGNPSGQPFMQ